MVTGVRGAPIRQHPFHASLGEIGLRDVLRYIGQTKSRDRGIQHLEGAVENKLAFDMHPQLAAVLLEFPGIETAMRRQPQIDAVVPDQVLWRLRLRASLEIRRRADNGQPDVWPDPRGN